MLEELKTPLKAPKQCIITYFGFSVYVETDRRDSSEITYGYNNEGRFVIAGDTDSLVETAKKMNIEVQPIYPHGGGV